MKKQSKSVNSNKVHGVRSAHERRVERQLDNAIRHPEQVEDWDAIDHTVLEHPTQHKKTLQ